MLLKKGRQYELSMVAPSETEQSAQLHDRRGAKHLNLQDNAINIRSLVKNTV